MNKSIINLVTIVTTAYLLMAPSLANCYKLNNQSIITTISGAGSGDVHFPW